MAKAPKLGEILVKLGHLTPQRLDGALMHQRQWGVSLGRALVAKNFCTEAQVLEGLSSQLGLPVIDLDKEEISEFYADTVPLKFAEQHHVVPIKTGGARGEVLVVAMAAPATMATQDATLAVSKKSRLQVFLATDEAVHRAIGRVYRGERYSAIGDSVVMDARERVVDFNSESPSGPRLAPMAPAAPSGGFFPGLSLSANCDKVLQYAAQVRKAEPKAIIEKILEDWAVKQLQAWAKDKAAAPVPAVPAPAAVPPSAGAAPKRTRTPAEFQITIGNPDKSSKPR